MPVKDLPVHPEQLSRIVLREGIAVREDTLYTNHKGAEKSRLRKRADQALARLKDTLVKVLEPDEAVFYVALAQEPLSTTMQLTLGWYAYTVSKCLLVATNRRLLVFGVKPKSFGRWEWGRRLRSIRWGDVAEAKARPGLLSGTLTLRYQNEKKEKFWNLRGGDARKLRKLLEALLPASVGEVTAERAPVSLCPNCVTALSPAQEKCLQCSLEFATRGEMIRRSLLFPGGGYFYVRLPFLGVLDAIGESVLIAFLAIYLLIAAGLPEPFLGPLDPYTSPGAALVIAAVLAVLLVMEKLVTILHARHAVACFVPLDKAPGKARAAVPALVAYGLIALFIWAVIPEREQPLLEVAPDVTVYRAEFGTFHQKQDGSIGFTPTDTVPHRHGQAFGFILRFRTPRPTVKLRTEFEYPDLAKVEVEPVADSPEQEENAEAEGGVVTRYWQIIGHESIGRQVLKVYLEGKLVGNFAFSVR